jgi:hypothetical protein
VSSGRSELFSRVEKVGLVIQRHRGGAPDGNSVFIASLTWVSGMSASFSSRLPRVVEPTLSFSDAGFSGTLVVPRLVPRSLAILSKNTFRRSLNKGQQAMSVAMAFRRRSQRAAVATRPRSQRLRTPQGLAIGGSPKPASSFATSARSLRKS